MYGKVWKMPCRKMLSRLIRVQLKCFLKMITILQIITIDAF